MYSTELRTVVHVKFEFFYCGSAILGVHVITKDQINHKKLRGLSPPANYTDRATAVCRRNSCQLSRIEGATWSTWRIPAAVFSAF
jgi:hypothetical protein